MNKYPAWKYAIIVIAIVVSLIYAAPNLFGEVPAVQVNCRKLLGIAGLRHAVHASHPRHP